MPKYCALMATMSDARRLLFDRNPEQSSDLPMQENWVCSESRRRQSCEDGLASTIVGAGVDPHDSPQRVQCVKSSKIALTWRAKAPCRLSDQRTYKLCVFARVRFCKVGHARFCKVASPRRNVATDCLRWLFVPPVVESCQSGVEDHV